MAASARLEIIRPSRSNSRFLLGDVPAISYDARRGALGIPGGVPFGDATTVFLSLTPTRLATLSRADRFEAVPARAVRQVNAFQVAKAHGYVYMHPDSGLQAFVSSERPPTGAVTPYLPRAALRSWTAAPGSRRALLTWEPDTTPRASCALPGKGRDCAGVKPRGDRGVPCRIHLARPDRSSARPAPSQVLAAGGGRRPLLVPAHSPRFRPPRGRGPGAVIRARRPRRCRRLRGRPRRRACRSALARG
jgi:hypothetical protein